MDPKLISFFSQAPRPYKRSPPTAPKAKQDSNKGSSSARVVPAQPARQPLVLRFKIPVSAAEKMPDLEPPNSDEEIEDTEEGDEESSNDSNEGEPERRRVKPNWDFGDLDLGDHDEDGEASDDNQDLPTLADILGTGSSSQASNQGAGDSVQQVGERERAVHLAGAEPEAEVQEQPPISTKPRRTKHFQREVDEGEDDSALYPPGAI